MSLIEADLGNQSGPMGPFDCLYMPHPGSLDATYSCFVRCTIGWVGFLHAKAIFRPGSIDAKFL